MGGEWHFEVRARPTVVGLDTREHLLVEAALVWEDSAPGKAQPEGRVAPASLSRESHVCRVPEGGTEG